MQNLIPNIGNLLKIAKKWKILLQNQKTSISRSLPLNSVDLSYILKITMNQLLYIQPPGYENHVQLLQFQFDEFPHNIIKIKRVRFKIIKVFKI